MPMTTYLMQFEGLQSTMEPDLDDLLDDARGATGQDWRILERTVRVRRHGFLWRKRSVERRYQLLVGVGSGEFEVINFWQPWHRQWSINDLVPPSLVMAYLHGLCAGVKSAN